MAENLIVDSMTGGATALGGSFVSLLTSLTASPVIIGLVGIGLAFGVLKFALNRIPGVR